MECGSQRDGRELLETLLGVYRRARVLAKRLLLIEPTVAIELQPALEFHGNDYCGWAVPRGELNRKSIVVDVGLGEDISFSTSLIRNYGCAVHGFDPTPRAIAYVKSAQPANFVLHEYGVGASPGVATFFLPNNEEHVSGSLVKDSHLGQRQIQVRLVGMAEVFDLIGAQRIDLLKLDIEGAEYDLIASPAFRACSERIAMLCVEFHHRWSTLGRKSTLNAVKELNALGFRCAWRCSSTNEEFLFVNVGQR